MDETALAATLRRGETAALEELIGRYTPCVTAVLARVLPQRREEWEELAADVFLAAWEGGTCVMCVKTLPDDAIPCILDPDTLELRVGPDDPLFVQWFEERKLPGLTAEDIIASDQEYFTLARSIKDIRLVLNGVVADALGSADE